MQAEEREIKVQIQQGESVALESLDRRKSVDADEVRICRNVSC
jgi:hypothetical protein